jgi:uncharacterized protein with PQ loop repeat
MQYMSGLVSKHIRKRKKQTSHRPRVSMFWISVLDKITTIAGIIGPLMTIPQIYQIYVLHLASGVSPISWLAFGLLDIPFITYGIVHKDRPIISTYILWLTFNMIVGIGAIVYG